MEYALVAKWFRWACQVANNFYPDHPLDLRVLIVLCNLAIFYIDDILVTDPQLLYTFQLALVTHQPQRDPILRCLADKLIPRMWRYFDPAAANAIAVGFYEFIIGTSMEADVRNMHLSPSAPDFPGFVRIKSGAPAQYAHWLFYSPTRQSPNDYIQAIPDFLVIINHVNDILSFYKEELAGEEDNLVHMRARTLGKSVLATLAELCAETEERINRVSKTLAPAPETQAVFKGFMVRYIHFHTSTTRYRLQELLAES
ncbi:hypothetical protein EIP86_011284 [Pleurotus ostreatoroseus]|nr:hypothetical protein EIP86_011284 [Pleurotus ostreatoroseus]